MLTGAETRAIPRVIWGSLHDLGTTPCCPSTPPPTDARERREVRFPSRRSSPAAASAPDLRCCYYTTTTTTTTACLYPHNDSPSRQCAAANNTAPSARRDRTTHLTTAARYRLQVPPPTTRATLAASPDEAVTNASERALLPIASIISSLTFAPSPFLARDFLSHRRRSLCHIARARSAPLHISGDTLHLRTKRNETHSRLTRAFPRCWSRCCRRNIAHPMHCRVRLDSAARPLSGRRRALATSI